MTRDGILTELKSERDGLSAAITALEGGRRGPGRPKGAYALSKRRTMSAAARKKISDAMRATWAVRKSRGASSASASAPPKRTLSAAARKRIAAAKKAWWAAKKKASKLSTRILINEE